MLPFKPVTFEDIPEIEKYLPYQNYRTSEYTVAGIFMWRNFYQISYCIVEEMLIIKMMYKSENPFFCIPVGPGSLPKALEALRSCCKDQKYELVFAAVPDGAIPALESAFGKPVSIEENRNWFDYLYLTEDLASLQGKKFKAPRNHINKFKRSYHSYDLHRITADNIGLVKDFYADYAPDNTPEGALSESESEAVMELLNEYFHLFGAIGYYLEVQGQVAGFAIGEIVNDTLFVHIEKASLKWHGTYQMLVNGFARKVPDNIKFINREEDVGIEGLRKSKLSYNPIELLSKSTVKVKI